jgi:hypothetical protein
MNEKQRAHWLNIRTKGYWHFVIVRGVLFWGIVTAFIFSALMSVFNEPSFLFYLLLAIPTFMIGGLFWGMWTWASAEKSYKIRQSQKSPSL